MLMMSYAALPALCGQDPRRRALLPVALIGLVVGATGTACRPFAVPVLSRAPKVAHVAASEPPCPAIPLDAELRRPRPAQAPAPPVSLQALLRSRSSKPPPRQAPRVDLGRIVHVEASEPRRRELFDLSRLDLPREIVREELPERLRERWDRLFADREEIRQIRTQHVFVSRKFSQCKDDSCPMERCLGQLDAKLGARIRGNEDAFRTRQGRFIEELQAFVSSVASGAPPGATLALSYAAEDRARVFSGMLSDLEAPIALYERVKQTAKPGSAIDWWARYLLGYALADMGEVGRARREFSALAALPAAPRLWAEASFRKGDFEPDPSQAVASFQAAARMSGGDPAARMVHWGATYRWADAELTRRHFQSALTVAAELSWSVERTATEQGELDSFVDLLMPVLAEAVNALAADEIEAPPAVPATIFGRLGAEVADRAIARFDVEAAVRAWQAVITYAADSLEAPRALTGLIAAHERADQPGAAHPLRKQRERDYGPASPWAALLRAAQANARPNDPRLVDAARGMPPPLPRIPFSDLDRERDLTDRVQALLFACDAARVLQDPGEIDLRVDLGREPRARITVQTPKGTDGAELTACLSALGPAYFVGAPAGLRVTVRFEEEAGR
jgi:hypothetical protein